MDAFKTVREIRDAIRDGKLTAVEATESTLADIKKRDGEIHAFLELFETDALAQAKKIDELKKNGEVLPPLAGVPVAIKDNMLYKGHTASCGSKILAEYKSAYTCTAVQRLVDAGAVIIGRTNMDEFAMGSSTETSAFGNTMNPWDKKKVPGGSSGGSAAAVAAGFVPASLGSDTGGSIRQPASLTGIVGLKPTYGRVSRYGVTALSSSLDQIGPFAHTVEDAAMILEAIEGRDEHDATSVDLEETTVGELLTPDFKGLRVGVPKEYFIDGMDEDIAKLTREAIEVFRKGGAEIIEMSLPLTPYALPTYYIIQPAEASSNLARFDGMRYGTRAPGTLEESYLNARGDGFGAEVKRRIMLGTFILSAGYFDAFYKKALAVRTALRKEFDEAFKQVDVIIGPTSPTVAWNLGEKFNDPLAMYLADIFTTAGNIAGIPGISIPCGFAHDLPVGLQLQAKPFGEAVLFRAAAAYEKQTGWNKYYPKA
ncbi:MAG: Asp-tRNA(Asn)/Glu-tRNA(Gln) amidotransferase subunit GatA [Patescibacteria group bacterium]|jgi:aspartyl-tRNA(Asn)/glutamyl-tRNA(Gln) amidotransferase subunit A